MCFAIGRWECGIERLPHTSAREREGGQAGRHGRFAIQGQRRKMPLLLWGRAVLAWAMMIRKDGSGEFSCTALVVFLRACRDLISVAEHGAMPPAIGLKAS